jgi:hypothetical protein
LKSGADVLSSMCEKLSLARRHCSAQPGFFCPI